MATITLDYSAMSLAENSAKKAGNKCGDYADKITSKVTNKISSLTYGQTTNTSQASYFAQKKISELNTKKSNYLDFANKLSTAREYAKEKDKSVASYIKNEATTFRQNHDMSVNVLVDFFVFFETTKNNSTAFGRFVSQLFNDISNWIDDKWRDLKRWWVLDGGKYVVTGVLTAIGAVMAAAVLVCVAWPALLGAIAGLATASGVIGTLAAIWTLITASAAFVTSVMAIADGLTKACGNFSAFLTNWDDPGWAQRYGGYSSLSDFLRNTLFESSFANRISYIAANIYDTVAIVATVINIADLAKTGFNFIKKIRTEGVYKIFNKMHFTTKSGKISWESFKHGMNTLFSNIKIAMDGLSRTNISKLNTYYKNYYLGEYYIKFEKLQKSANTISTTYDSIVDKGTFSVALDKIKEKIQSKIVGYDYFSKTQKAWKSIKTLQSEWNPKYTY